MKRYPEYQGLNLPEIDRQYLKRWAEAETFERSMLERADKPAFVFYEGPPSANGLPGIHHVLARSVKDIFCRYQTMKGKYVQRKAGWDTHGLPIELAVEKKLGITKEAIGKTISVADYNQECRKTVMAYTDIWDDLTRKMGYWVDLSQPYVTYDKNYIESVWHLLQKLYKKGYLYKGLSIQPYSPAAGTGLSSHELNQPGCYRNVKDTTCTAMFAIKDEDKRYFLAWTTTPWTLPANTALALGAKIVYAEIETLNPYNLEPIRVILAKDLLPKYFKEAGQNASVSDYLALEEKARQKAALPWLLKAEHLGSDLAGLSYLPLFDDLDLVKDFAQANPQAFRSIIGDFVSTEDGTGIVHISPTFGADDRRVAEQAGIGGLMTEDKNGLPSPIVDLRGQYVPSMGLWAYRYVKPDYLGAEESEERPLDVDLCIHLKNRGLAFKIEKYEHNYPHCWRTDKPVLYYPLDAWFIKTSAVKERMVELNKSINWKPKHTGEGRFSAWLENIRDWNLSRSRYWGIPLPIWRSEDGRRELCLGSIAELQAATRQSLEQAQQNPHQYSQADKQALEKAHQLAHSPDFDLHRPFIDDIVLLDAETGQILRRESDLIDVWFDSGAMPYAQWHYPFENAERIENGLAQNGQVHAFPADFIAEGVDQTRGWFYTLHAIAVLCFDSLAYKNVISNGLVLDKDGRKMSKRLGNAIDPFTTLAKYGADATRWYMITNAQPWDDLRFNLEQLEDGSRQFFGTLYNTYTFFATYANIDQFDPTSPAPAFSQRPEIDQWILSRLHQLIEQVDSDFSNYEPTNAGRKIEQFLDLHLSNWYVRLCRRRFWKSEDDQDKLAAYHTLFECLFSLSKLIAPIAPFFADWLYNNLNAEQLLEPHDSVHLAFFPQVKKAWQQPELDQRMDYAQRICSLVHALRKAQKIRVRQPLQKILLPVLDPEFKAQVERVKDLILSEVNVKTLEYVDDASDLLRKKAKPNFRSLGKKLGKYMKEAQLLIEAFQPADLQKLEQTGRYVLEIEGQSFETLLEDYQIVSEDLQGWQVAHDGPLTLALDVQINEALYAEGLARELVNRIQHLRKEQGFAVTDRIALSIEKTEFLAQTLEHFGAYISQEVLALRLDTPNRLDSGHELELLDQISVRIDLAKAELS